MFLGIDHCMLCDKDIGYNPANRTEVVVMWSNGSKMPIGICLACARDHKFTTEEGKQAITQWHWTYWEKAGGKYDKGVTIV